MSYSKGISTVAAAASVSIVSVSNHSRSGSLRRRRLVVVVIDSPFIRPSAAGIRLSFGRNSSCRLSVTSAVTPHCFKPASLSALYSCSRYCCAAAAAVAAVAEATEKMSRVRLRKIEAQKLKIKMKPPRAIS